MASFTTSRQVSRALEYMAIGTNLYIFTQWNRFLVRPKDSTPSPADTAARLQHERHMHDHYLVSQHNLAQGRYHTLLTSAFSHVHPAHLAVNMFMLHQATSIATSRAVGLGPLRLATLALGAALSGSAGFLYDNTTNNNNTNGSSTTSALGASGMVQGMLVATMLAAPRLPVYAFFIPVPIAYRTVVGAYLAWDMYHLYEERTGGGPKKGSWTGSYVGYAAHLGGAAFGAAFYLVAMRRGRPMPLRRKLR